MEEAAVFDTLAYANKLKKVGISEKQANTHAQLLSEAIVNEIVTRKYLDSKLDTKIAEVYIKLAELKAELIRWVLATAIAQISIILSCVRLIH